MAEQKEKNWWGRNWKWCVPVGCLGALAILACFIAVIIFAVFGIMKTSGAYTDAVAKAREHAVVQEVLGTPIEEGVFITGNINVSGPSGQADLSIPLSGPHGKARLMVAAEKSVGQWTFSSLVLDVNDTDQRIDLLE